MKIVKRAQPKLRTKARIFEFHLIWALFGLFIVIIALSACTFADSSNQQPKANCDKTADPTDNDVKKALAYTGDIFQTGDWKRVYTVGDQRIAITWDHKTLNGLAYMEYLVWDCGYTQAELDSYFSQSNFKDVFFNSYQNPTELNHCTGENGLTLYEYSATYKGEPYSIRYWSKLESPTRILTLMTSFPTKDKAVQDKLANQLFPKLVACP
jgi:hypothetical protein